MEAYDIQRLIIIVQCLLDELHLIKKRKYFRAYYRKHREKLKTKLEKKKTELAIKTGERINQQREYILTFD